MSYSASNRPLRYKEAVVPGLTRTDTGFIWRRPHMTVNIISGLSPVVITGKEKERELWSYGKSGFGDRYFISFEQGGGGRLHGRAFGENSYQIPLFLKLVDNHGQHYQFEAYEGEPPDFREPEAQTYQYLTANNIAFPYPLPPILIDVLKSNGKTITKVAERLRELEDRLASYGDASVRNYGGAGASAENPQKHGGRRTTRRKRKNKVIQQA